MAFNFQNFQVYKDARQLRKELHQVTKDWPREEKYVLIDQIKRALLSVMLQIAEGSNRKTDKDKALFFNRSHTSIDEILACLDAAIDDGLISEAQYADFYKKCENIAKQFRGLAKYLSKDR